MYNTEQNSHTQSKVTFSELMIWDGCVLVTAGRHSVHNKLPLEWTVDAQGDKCQSHVVLLSSILCDDG